MRLSAGAVLNAAAWVVCFGLICLAGVVTYALGFLGLALLGGATTLVCVMAELDNDVPTWGTEVFRARMDHGRSPEQRAAHHAERAAFVSPIRFYRNCGITLEHDALR